MPEEVKEESFVKLRKEDVGPLKTFYSTTAVASVTGTWKKKSVSIISPKSGFFSRLIEDFKKSKVGDFAYQQTNIRKNSSYKPFWATKVIEPKIVEEATHKTSVDNVLSTNKISKSSDDTVEEKAAKKTDNVVQKNYSLNNKLIFDKEFPAPKVKLTKNAKVNKPIKPKKPMEIKLDSVDLHKEYRLKIPPSYNGSEMYMPTGERVFWVCFCL